jgi:hypothetical protein
VLFFSSNTRLAEQELVQMEESLKQQFNGKKQANGTPPPADGP